MNKTIGIDLGTSRSSMNYLFYIAEKAIHDGYQTYLYHTPSIVEFTKTKRSVGNAAGIGFFNSENTVYGAKRLLGRNFADPETQAYIRHSSCKVINKQGKPRIQIEYKNEKRILTPEEILSMTLARLKGAAETKLETEIKDAVISVPVCFNESQRQATRDAGRIAGLNVLGIINEPTATAIAYRHLYGPQVGHFLFFDLGGGTLSVSLVYMDKGLIQVKASGGSTDLGGQDFTNRLADFLAQDIQQKTKEDVLGDIHTLRLLRDLAEREKHYLSEVFETRIRLPRFKGMDYNITITRAQFEELCEDLFSKAIDIVEEVLKEANIDKSEVHEVVLVGSSSITPKVQEKLSEFFTKKKHIHPMTGLDTVAYGAAIQAAILAGEYSPQEQDLSLKDVSPLSLGLKVEDDLMWNVDSRTSTVQIPLPEICTTEDYQTEIVVQVKHGDGRLNKAKTLFETFTLTGLTSSGALNAQVSFNIDANGVLTVSAVEKGINNTQDIAITSNTGNLSIEEIDRMAKDAENYKQDDDMELARLHASCNLESYISTHMSTISEQKSKIPPKTMSKLETAAGKTLKCVRQDKYTSIQEVEAMRKEIEAIIEPIIAALDRGGDSHHPLMDLENMLTSSL